MLLPHCQFQEVINPNNQVMLLLHAHWIAINEIMAFIMQQEHLARGKSPPDERENGADIDPGFQRWLKHLNSHVDYEHQAYNRWPMSVEEQLDQDITCFGKSGY